MLSELAISWCSRIPLPTANQLKPCGLLSCWNAKTTRCGNNSLGSANKRCMKSQPFGKSVKLVAKESVGSLWVSRRLIVGGGGVLPLVMMVMGGGEGSPFSAYARPKKSEIEEVLTEYVVQDLNGNPQLPFEGGSFDIITNVVSVDYLTRPLEVFKEMCRVLKPGGLAIMSFSNRCFWTKAISIWTSTGDADHVLIVGSYFHYAGGFEPPQAIDISPNPGRSDPLYVVYARKALA